ncbi:tryptophan synthase subunit alpha [Candidatus Pelagibacter sp.]|nr:tryptophan synthase subunit alpha [Candidatus Pelagibacter sp.]
MISLIKKTFEKTKNENRPALLTYTVAGDNTKKKSLEILKSISKYSDICELGFPHNTPIADGGQIQTSAYRAIKNGIKINDVFSIANKFKKLKKNKPIILMGYYNMIYQYNENKFISKCKKSKIDGLIVVDLPYPENKALALKCKKKGINFIQLVSPTTSKERLIKIIRDSHDMIYYISMLSTTGGKLKVAPKKILERYKTIKSFNKSKNIVIGFGITKKTIKSLKKADGLVVGSAICEEITKSIYKKQNTVINVTNIVKKLRNEIR